MVGSLALVGSGFLGWRTSGAASTLSGYETANLALSADPDVDLGRSLAVIWYAVPLAGGLALAASALPMPRIARFVPGVLGALGVVLAVLFASGVAAGPTVAALGGAMLVMRALLPEPKGTAPRSSGSASGA